MSKITAEEVKNPYKLLMSDLVKGDKFIIASLGGMNTFKKQSQYHGFTTYHYVMSNGKTTTSVSNCTVYKFKKQDDLKSFCNCGCEKDFDCKYCTSCNKFNSI